jgi:hypothetical protein
MGSLRHSIYIDIDELKTYYAHRREPVIFSIRDQNIRWIRSTFRSSNIIITDAYAIFRRTHNLLIINNKHFPWRY